MNLTTITDTSLVFTKESLKLCVCCNYLPIITMSLANFQITSSWSLAHITRLIDEVRSRINPDMNASKNTSINMFPIYNQEHKPNRETDRKQDQWVWEEESGERLEVAWGKGQTVIEGKNHGKWYGQHLWAFQLNPSSGPTRPDPAYFSGLPDLSSIYIPTIKGMWQFFLSILTYRLSSRAILSSSLPYIQFIFHLSMGGSIRHAQIRHFCRVSKMAITLK